jgi:hypothetical protein
MLVIIKTSHGKIIGGFNPRGWNSQLDRKWSPDHQKGTFIFSADLKQKMDLIQPTKAIGNNKDWGPYFGEDIAIADKCNINKNSTFDFPSCYNFTPKPYSNDQNSKEVFSGSKDKSIQI